MCSAAEAIQKDAPEGKAEFIKLELASFKCASCRVSRAACRHEFGAVNMPGSHCIVACVVHRPCQVHTGQDSVIACRAEVDDANPAAGLALGIHRSSAAGSWQVHRGICGGVQGEEAAAARADQQRRAAGTVR